MSKTSAFVKSVTSVEKISLGRIENRLGLFLGNYDDILTIIEDLNDKEIEETFDIEESTIHSMPDYISRLIKGRVETHSIPQTQPTSGQIRELTIQGVPSMMYILISDCFLDPETGEEKYYGWMCSGDQEYASWWDFIVQEENGPTEPCARMVQIWNPIQVKPKALGRVVGNLSNDNFLAVKNMAIDFMFGNVAPTIIEPESGILARTTSGGYPVVTGTPQKKTGDINDYQELYYRAANKVKESSM